MALHQADRGPGRADQLFDRDLETRRHPAQHRKRGVGAARLEAGPRRTRHTGELRDGHRVASPGHLALLTFLDTFEFPAEIVNPPLDQSAIFFQLFLTRPAQSDGILLSREMRPHPFQPGHGIFVLGQFDSQSGLTRLRSAGEDVEDQLGPVEHLHAGGLFEVARLAGRQVVVEDDHIGLGRLDEGGQLDDLAASHIGGRVRHLPALR